MIPEIPVVFLDRPLETTIEQAMRQAARDALTRTLAELLDEYLTLWTKKQNDHGPKNIGIHQERGVVIRLIDKLAKLSRRYLDGVEMQDEGIEDVWLDTCGYALIGLVCERGLWPRFTLEDLKADKPEDRRDSHRCEDPDWKWFDQHPLCKECGRCLNCFPDGHKECWELFIKAEAENAKQLWKKIDEDPWAYGIYEEPPDGIYRKPPKTPREEERVETAETKRIYANFGI